MRLNTSNNVWQQLCEVVGNTQVCTVKARQLSDGCRQFDFHEAYRCKIPKVQSDVYKQAVSVSV